MWHAKPPDPRRNTRSILDDPQVETWEDGSMWYHNPTGGYQRLSGPDTQTPIGARKAGSSDPDLAALAHWLPVVLIAFVTLLAIIGAITLYYMFTGHAVGCTPQAGCYIFIPHK